MRLYAGACHGIRVEVREQFLGVLSFYQEGLGMELRSPDLGTRILPAESSYWPSVVLISSEDVCK